MWRGRLARESVGIVFEVMEVCDECIPKRTGNRERRTTHERL
jgi:hypothetical protein